MILQLTFLTIFLFIQIHGHGLPRMYGYAYANHPNYGYMPYANYPMATQSSPYAMAHYPVTQYAKYAHPANPMITSRAYTGASSSYAPRGRGIHGSIDPGAALNYPMAMQNSHQANYHYQQQPSMQMASPYSAPPPPPPPSPYSAQQYSPIVPVLAYGKYAHYGHVPFITMPPVQQYTQFASVPGSIGEMAGQYATTMQAQPSTTMMQTVAPFAMPQATGQPTQPAPISVHLQLPGKTQLQLNWTQQPQAQPTSIAPSQAQPSYYLTKLDPSNYSSFEPVTK